MNKNLYSLVLSKDVVDEIGEDDARAIFYYLLNEEKPSMRAVVSVANLASVIGYDNAEAIFNELISY